MNELGVLDAPNISRLIEDMAATLPLFVERQASGRSVQPPAALLAALGQCYLDEGEKFQTSPIAGTPDFVALTEAWYWPTGVGDVHLSYFLAGVILARRDVWTQFGDQDCGDGGIDWLRCLQWLVMHGAKELSLVPFFHKSFVASLRRETVVVGRLVLSPLELLVSQERPEWIVDSGGDRKVSYQSAVNRWLKEENSPEFDSIYDIGVKHNTKSRIEILKSRYLSIKQ